MERKIWHYGKVYLVGAGPGDPKLLTVKAVELLKEADVVIYDRLVGEEILNLAPEKAEKLYVGKRTGKHEVPQDKITELIIEKAQDRRQNRAAQRRRPIYFWQRRRRS